MSITKKEALAAAEQEYMKNYASGRGNHHLGIFVDAWLRAVEWTQSDALARQTPIRATIMSADGYDELGAVLGRAFDQAASGKGKDRHQVGGEPFTKQVMQDMARRFGVGALLGQAFKKSEESQRLPRERAIAELLGAINYLAGAVIHLEAQPAAANDNAASGLVWPNING